MLSMAGSGLEAGAGTSKDGDAAVSCEQCVPTWAWGQYWLWHLILQGMEVSLEQPK